MRTFGASAPLKALQRRFGFEPDRVVAILMAAWLLVFVTGTSRLLRPMLITRRSRLPAPVLFLAVLGGLLTWGFSGMFLGAAAIAVAWSLMHAWLQPGRAPPIK